MVLVQLQTLPDFTFHGEEEKGIGEKKKKSPQNRKTSAHMKFHLEMHTQYSIYKLSRTTADFFTWFLPSSENEFKVRGKKKKPNAF